MSPFDTAEPGAGVRILGEMTASLSHDLKNHLAIINENAGLLEDLAAMAGEETLVDPNRVATIAGKIRNQVRRADDNIKRLNHVGHSVDAAYADVDMEAIVSNVIALTERKAKLKAVNIEKKGPVDPVIVKTDPFLLYQLVWEGLNGAIDMVRGTLNVELHMSPEKAEFSIGPLTGVKETEGLMNSLQPISSTLGSVVKIESENQTLVFHISRYGIE